MDAYQKQTYWSYGLYLKLIVADSRNGPSNISSSTTVASGTSSVNGYRNPQWKDQIRLGQNATTPFTGVKYSGGSVPILCVAGGSIVSPSRSVTQQAYGNLGYPMYATAINVPSTVVADVTNRCLRKFLDRANEALGSGNLTGRSIKHLKHDLHSVIHPMSSLRTKISSYLSTLEKASKGLNKRSQAWINVIRDEYLQFTFGTAPFVDDITAIMVDLGRRRFPSYPIHASDQHLYSASVGQYDLVSSSNPAIPSLLHLNSICKVTSTYSVKMKGAIHTNATHGQVSVAQDLRLLPADFVPTAFSILPYAWMIDYFTNIGDIIEAYSFPWSNMTWSCQTAKTVNEVTYSDPVASFNDGGSSSWINRTADSSGGSAKFTYEKVERSSISPSGLIPDLVLNIPTKPKQWVNMFAAFLPRILGLVIKT